MLKEVLFLLVGFFILIKGADKFVEGASKIAAKFHIPQIVIGLTIVAFGTSAPEAAISITSAMAGSVDLAVGNVIGSNIMNVLLILGIAGILAPLGIKKNTYRYEIPFVMVITLVLVVLGKLGNSIDFMDGVILWVIFLGFMYYLYRLVKSGEGSVDEIEELDEKDTFPKLIIFAIGGIVAIVVGSDLTIDSATAIATTLGVSERLIGLTIVAFGTSLPELITSAMAALKGKTDITIGNIIGSNIFNILFVLGTTALVSPTAITFESSFIVDGLVAIGALILFFVCINSELKLRKSGAIIMLLTYVAYFVSLL